MSRLSVVIIISASVAESRIYNIIVYRTEGVGYAEASLDTETGGLLLEPQEPVGFRELSLGEIQLVIYICCTTVD